MASRVRVECDFVVSPVRGLNDRPVSIKVTGLDPERPVTIRARLVDDFGRSWESWAVFGPDSTGSLGSTPSRRPREPTRALTVWGCFGL